MFAKDVAAYALLIEVDNNTVLQGVNYTRIVKRYIRTVAEASAGTVGKSPSEYVNPQQLKENDPEWFKFMYQNKFEPAEISIEMKVRLAHVRNMLACRNTKHCCISAPQPMLQQGSLLGNQFFRRCMGNGILRMEARILSYLCSLRNRQPDTCCVCLRTCHPQCVLPLLILLVPLICRSIPCMSSKPRQTQLCHQAVCLRRQVRDAEIFM